MKLSAHLVTYRLGYSHHGIFVGGNQVIHYTGKTGYAEVVISTLNEFCKDDEVEVKENIFDAFTAEEIVARAYSRLGEQDYNLIFNNCEHFANWCIYGIAASSQVNNLALSALLPVIHKTTVARSITASLLAPTTLTLLKTSVTPAAALMVAGPIYPLALTAVAAVGCYRLFKSIYDV